MSSKDRPHVDPGTIFGEFKIECFIGHGSFGDIYSCTELKNGKRWAIKLESKENKKSNLEKEAEFLQEIQGHDCFPIYRDYGETDQYRYYVMELLGPSLLQARRISPGCIFSSSTALRLGIEMLKCIETFHSLGYLHRDIKPGNFLLRPNRKNPLILIDYGLSRKFLDDEGKEIEPRDHPGFVGTVPYASLNAHNGLELGRCDDLFSWFAVLLKIHAGELPWPNTNDKPTVYAAKRDADISSFCVGLPSQYVTIYRIIIGMKREDVPNYALLYNLLAQAMVKVHASFLERFDWEEAPKDSVANVTTLSLDMPRDEPPDVPKTLPNDLVEKLMVPPESSSSSYSDTELDYDHAEEAEGGCACRI